MQTSRSDPKTSQKELEEKLRDAARNGNTNEVMKLDGGINIDATDEDGHTPLMMASHYGHVECVEVLLGRGAQANIQDKDGLTPLMRAALYGHVECVKLLLYRGAQANLQDKFGLTALTGASIAGHLECIKLLLDRGAQANLQNKDGLTPLIGASLASHIECVNVLLDKGAQVNLQDKDGHSPLLMASRAGHVECVKVLLDRGAQVNLQDKDGLTPLIMASIAGHTECVKVLLDKGAQANNHQDKDGYTSTCSPLMVAATYGHDECVKVLLDGGAQVNIQNKDGITPLMMASKAGHAECVKVLLDGGAQTNLHDKDGYTALLAASISGYVECVKVLLDKGAKANIQDKYGYACTPLIMASIAGHVECVKVLLDGGAQANLQDKNGHSPLLMASVRGHTECVKVLLDRGAHANLQDKDGNTPLFGASRYGHIECVKLLLDRGAQANFQDKDGLTPLNIASGIGHAECVKVLLDWGALANLQDKEGHTPLTRASLFGNFECVKVLLDSGAQANLQNKDGHSPLLMASRAGHVECVKVLLDRGAQVNLQDNDGITPLTMASKAGHAECVKVLLDGGAQANLHDKEELKEAVQNSRVDEVIRLIQLNKTAKDPEQMLRDAAACGRTEEMKRLHDAGVNINATDKYGCTPLMEASRLGHVQCVKVLLDWGAQVNLQNKDDGWTALHYAAAYKQIDVAKALLATPGIDVNIQNSSGLIPLKLATTYEVLTMLGKYATSCEDYPVHSFGKVILCGNTGSGKTTLAQAIQYTFDKGKPPSAILPGPVKLLTAGIVPHLIKNREMNMMLYDLAGHREYYSSHSAVLESISVSPSTFLMLVNLLLDLKEIASQLYYWSAMIGDVCHKCPQQSSVIVVGTHADGIADRGILESICEAVERIARDALKKHNFVGVTALNATVRLGNELESFTSLLQLTNVSVIAKHPAISLNSHMTYSFLKDKVPPHQDAISLSQLVTLLGQEEPKFLPTEASEITPLLKTLSDKGFIVFLEGDEDSDSWIVIRPEALLEKVNGVLFAPSFFKEYVPIASNTGVISVADLRQHFPEPTYNIDMILQFMKSFELCVPITLTDVDTNMMSPNTPSTDLGPLFFFPACVNIEMPSSVTIPQMGFVWLICTTDSNQFFSPRCVHALSTRLAHGWALPKVVPSLIAAQKAYNRRCTVWNRGIRWMNEEGITTVVEIQDNSRCLSCNITFTDESSPTYLLSVMKVIKEACEEFCPSVSLVELIKCPPEATSDHTATTVELPLLKKRIQNKGNTLADSTGERQVIVSEWMKVEPRLLDLIGMEEQATPALLTLEQLLHFTSKARKFNVATEVGIEYSKLGVFLLKDNTGAVVKALENEHMKNAEKINMDILSRWLQGNGAKPVAWSTLTVVLRKIGLCALANDIEESTSVASSSTQEFSELVDHDVPKLEVSTAMTSSASSQLLSELVGQAVPKLEVPTAITSSASSQLLSELVGQAVPKLEGVPTMLELLSLAGNVAVQVGVHYLKFGIFLLEDTKGVIVKALEMEHRGNAEQINMAILQKWLHGMGVKPVTWSSLVTVLKKLECER